MSGRSNNTQVIVVGAGPVGLCAALELALRGIEIAIVDPVADLAERSHPRARTANLRSAEHFRRWGISDAVRAETGFPIDWPSRVEFRTTLAGYLIATFEDALLSSPEQSDLYPEPSIQIRQVHVEAAARARLAQLPNVATYYGQEVAELAETDVGVRAVVRGPEGAAVLHAAYVIGADGGRSIVRRAFNFEMIGQTAISNNVQVLFRAPGIYEALGIRRGFQYWCLSSTPPGFIQTTSPFDEFTLSLHKLPDPDSFIAAGVDDAVRSAIGSDYPFEVTGVDPWTIHARIAENYRKGSAFVVGDAARQHSTYGGHGMNVGVSDAADIGWKLAAVLSGLAPRALLDTFNIERRPIGVAVLEEATASFQSSPVNLVHPGMNDSGPAGDAVRAQLRDTIRVEKAQQFQHIGTQLGYNCAGSPIIVSDGSTGPKWTPNVYQPSASPGYIAPHSWLADGTSLYDHFGQWYTLLVLGEVTPDAGLPSREWLTQLRIPDDQLRDLYEADYVLVRPDQHVAWRGNNSPTDDVLETAIGARLVRASRPFDTRLRTK